MQGEAVSPHTMQNSGALSTLYVAGWQLRIQHVPLLCVLSFHRETSLGLCPTIFTLWNCVLLHFMIPIHTGFLRNENSKSSQWLAVVPWFKHCCGWCLWTSLDLSLMVTEWLLLLQSSFLYPNLGNRRKGHICCI